MNETKNPPLGVNLKPVYGALLFVEGGSVLYLKINMFLKKMSIKKLAVFTTLIFIFIVSVSLDSSADENNDPVSKFDAILNNYVASDGSVNYKGLKGDESFQGFIDYLSKADPDTLPSDNHRLAFWINAYNAFVLKGVVDAYPIKSVTKIGLIPYSFFKVRKFDTKHGRITLDKLESKKIREPFSEPRIHFAINCASIGCPQLLNKAYKAEILDKQLEEQTKLFINNKNKNYLNKKDNILYLSKIFKWYEGDFVKEGQTLKTFIAKYLNDEDAAYINENDIMIEYLEYDWNLNARREK